jgi:hypothetical protein
VKFTQFAIVFHQQNQIWLTYIEGCVSLSLNRGDMPLKLNSWLKYGFILTLGTIVVSSLIGCCPQDIPLNIPISSPSAVASVTANITPDMSTPTPDVLIAPAQSGQVIPVSVGQIIEVANPSLSMKWKVSYASEVLELLTSQENLHAPGRDGWLFRAITPGKTDLMLTSMPQACSNNTPCPPMPARFVFTIEVK